MFEEICLVCGRQVDDGYVVARAVAQRVPERVSRRAYCSDACQNQDTTSPSISSASSPFSSPHMEYAVGGDVPALVPSALGTSLKYHRRTYPSVSSSSASSTSWSLVTDEEEGDTLLNVESDWPHEGSEAAYENMSKLSVYPSGLSYARRPSGTNNRSTIPLLHRRTSSGSSSGHGHGIPCSAPIASSCAPSVRIATTDEDGDDEAYNSDLEYVTAHRRLREDARRKSVDKGSTIRGRVKRTRNRASLPACFSLLTITGSGKSQNSPPGTTGPQLSPSTPKLTLTGLPHSFGVMQATPRGRRLDTAGVTVRGRRKSRSRSPHHATKTQHAEIWERFRQAFEDEEKATAATAATTTTTTTAAPRGRTAVRRSGSSPARVAVDGEGKRALSGSRRGRTRESGERGRERGVVRGSLGLS